MAGPSSIDVLLEVPITFEAVTGASLHAPMVEATVRGVPTRLILDTGSSDHILTRELADVAGLSYAPSDPGTDSVGASVASWTVGALAIQVGDGELLLQDALAIVGPAQFAGWGIGGFLSPQRLHPTAYAVLDLVTPTLTLMQAEETDVVASLRARHPGMRPLMLNRTRGEGELLIHAAVEPFPQVVTLLDTGGRRTEFAAAAVPGVRTNRHARTGRGRRGRRRHRSGSRRADLASRRCTRPDPGPPRPGSDGRSAGPDRDGRAAWNRGGGLRGSRPSRNLDGAGTVDLRA